MEKTNRIQESIDALKHCLSLELDNIEVCPLAMVEGLFSSIEQNILPHFKQEIIQIKRETADSKELLEYQQLQMMQEIQEQEERMRQIMMSGGANVTAANLDSMVRICLACGAEVPEGEVFCGECGTRM